MTQEVRELLLDRLLHAEHAAEGLQRGFDGVVSHGEEVPGGGEEQGDEDEGVVHAGAA